MATDTPARNAGQSSPTQRSKSQPRASAPHPKGLSDRIAAEAERAMLIQLGAVLRAGDTMISSVRSPAALNERMTKQLDASQRRGTQARGELRGEVQRRREQMARIARRARRQAET